MDEISKQVKSAAPLSVKVALPIVVALFATSCVELVPLEGDPYYDERAQRGAYTPDSYAGAPARPTATSRANRSSKPRGTANKIRATDRQQTTLAHYFAAYMDKDSETILALFDEDILSAVHPDIGFGRGITVARRSIESDFTSRPEAFAIMPERLHVERDKWFTFGQSINGNERSPLWILFDFNEAGDKIEATYAQIGAPVMVTGPSVSAPTPGMRAATDQLDMALENDDLLGVVAQMAENTALYQFPPAELENQTPIVTGASDVASVLLFKWGEGAWGEKTTAENYMQFALRLIPGADRDALDRVALFTFDADPASPSYEKIIRIDVIGQ